MKVLILLFALFFAPLVAEIKEIDRFDRLLSYGSCDTLFVLDIDTTLMTTAQQFGSEMWFDEKMKSYKKEGLTEEEALEKTLPVWEAAQNISKMVLMEESIPSTIKALQKNNYMMMGLTTRGLGIATRTSQQLKALNIDLSITAPTTQDQFFTTPESILFRKGTLFTAGTHKGEALFKFLDHLKICPKTIVYVNEKMEPLAQVQEIATRRNICFIGLKYPSFIKSLQSEITDLQYRHFIHILSDGEARSLLNNLN